MRLHRILAAIAGLMAALSACSTSDIGSSASDVPVTTPSVESQPVIGTTDAQGSSQPADVAPVEPATPGLDPAGGVEGPLMYWRERPDGERESEAALIEGVLVREGDCLFVGDDDFRSVVLWEYGTRWLADKSAVALPDGATVPVGSQIAGRGGGYHAADQLSFFTASDAVLNRAGRCAGPAGEVAVIQS